MALTDTQRKALRAKLRRQHVKTRESEGATLSYVEGWHVVAEANRIFGFDSWDRQTLPPQCHWTHLQHGQTVCFYSTKVRITVRAGETVTIREGVGCGVGRSPHADVAHDIALKAAETDATKRALATFGNPFGLALYDREQVHVTKARQKVIAERAPSEMLPPLPLIFDGARKVAYDNDQDFLDATLSEIGRLGSVDSVYEFWSSNVAAFNEFHRRTRAQDTDPAQGIITALKERARQVGTTALAGAVAGQIETENAHRGKEPGTAVLIPKEQRIRDRDHLAFVASQPCLVCGRRPAQAHHLRFAQPRGMGLKVSDEFTLPLCNTHHDAVHRTGDERAWWARHGIIEPLKYADRLWAASHDRRKQGVAAGPDIPWDDSEFSEPSLKKAPAEAAKNGASSSDQG